MKFKPISLLVGAIAIAVATTPVIARSEQPSVPTQLFPVLAGIELTPQQQDQIAQTRQASRSKIEGILTSEQQNQFKAALERGDGLLAAIAAANLSSEQQAQVRTVFQSARTQVANTLTLEQRQQILQNLGSAWGRALGESGIMPSTR